MLSLPICIEKFPSIKWGKEKTILKHSVVGEWPSKNAYSLISGVCEYALVYGRLDCTDIIKVIDFKIKILFWIFPSGSNLITSSFKSREISPARVSEMLRNKKPERREV